MEKDLNKLKRGISNISITPKDSQESTNSSQRPNKSQKLDSIGLTWGELATLLDETEGIYTNNFFELKCHLNQPYYLF